jgi:hypothetical protein
LGEFVFFVVSFFSVTFSSYLDLGQVTT